MKALIIAFDGILADTLLLRAEALESAARSHDLVLRAHSILPALAGRTMGECAEQLLSSQEAVGRDPTLIALVSIAAERAASAHMRAGVTLETRQVQRVQQAAAAGVRVIVRSDSRRAEVTPLLEQSGLESIVTLRCSDDPVSTVERDTEHDAERRASHIAQIASLPAGYTSLVRAYTSIAQRLDSQQVLMRQREAHEVSVHAATVAAAFAWSVHTGA